MAKRANEGKPGGPQLTWAKFQTICATLAYTGLKNKSCQTHGFSMSTVTDVIVSQYDLGDAEWRALWEQSMEDYRETLVGEARRRSVEGVEEPVFYKGEVAGHVIRYSDRLLDTMLRAQVPEFREKVEVSGTVQHIAVPDIFANLSLEAKRAIRRIMLEDLQAQAEASGVLHAKPAQQLIEGEVIPPQDDNGQQQ